MPAWAAGSDVVGINLLWLALILMSARLFAPLAQRVGFPAVLGELLLGVALGNLALIGIDAFEAIPKDPIVAFIAELGVIVLLLQIGLETRLADLIKVGPRAFAVGCVGIVVPFGLGTWVVGPWLLPGLSPNAYLFLGATLAATSVGITGRVFRDLGKLEGPNKVWVDERVGWLFACGRDIFAENIARSTGEVAEGRYFLVMMGGDCLGYGRVETRDGKLIIANIFDVGDFRRLAETHPRIHAAILRNIAAALATKLRRANRQISVLGAQVP